jgi:hypothetical protein
MPKCKPMLALVFVGQVLEPVIDFFLGNTAFFRSVAPQDTIFRVRSVVNP